MTSVLRELHRKAETIEDRSGEVCCQLYIARDQDHLADTEFNELYDQAEKGARQLYRLIQHLDDGDNTSRVRELPSKYVA